VTVRGYACCALLVAGFDLSCASRRFASAMPIAANPQAIEPMKKAFCRKVVDDLFGRRDVAHNALDVERPAEFVCAMIGMHQCAVFYGRNRKPGAEAHEPGT
jgi:hypothetical protein